MIKEVVTIEYVCTCTNCGKTTIFKKDDPDFKKWVNIIEEHSETTICPDCISHFEKISPEIGDWVVCNTDCKENLGIKKGETYKVCDTPYSNNDSITSDESRKYKAIYVCSNHVGWQVKLYISQYYV